MMKFTAVLVFAFVAAATAISDADYWKQKGQLNAERDLSKFDAIVAGLAKGDDVTVDLVQQLKWLKDQIKDADDNNKSLLPKINLIIGQINNLVKGKPNFIEKGLFKALMAIVDGQRDNKSYYGDKVSQLKAELLDVQNATISTRDNLDSMAAKFVKSIKSLHVLASDIGDNLDQIHEIAESLKDITSEGKTFLTESAALVKKVSAVVSAHKA
ncbi:hypothetical protein HDE_05986 [Halotydeus destructor]|nr:hypothetical protein HDE_05986 [Halotydeus destructor]